MMMVMADFSQTRIFGKVDGQFLHARWRLKSPILDAQIGGWAVSFTRSLLDLIVGLGISLVRPFLESVWSLVV